MVTPMMGSYGIGVSRLVGAIIEASHDDAGHRLARSGRAVEGRPRHHARRRRGEHRRRRRIYAKLTAAGVETLYDDRDERGGVKLGAMDLIGLPWQLIIGPRGLAAGTVELKNRRTGEKVELSHADALARLTA